MYFDVSTVIGRKRVFFTLAAIYTLFIIYGTLIPLDFRHISLRDVWQVLAHAETYQLRIGSRSDLAANVLLYIPFGFFWLAYIEYDAPDYFPYRRMLVWLSAVTLSASLEVLQIFAPLRSFDLRDLLCNAAGVVIGIAVWHWKGRMLVNRFVSLRWHSGFNGVARQILVIYLSVLAVYHLMPLDIVISPVEIYRDIKSGALVIVPFTAETTPWFNKIHHFSIELFIWAVVGSIWFFSSRHSALLIWAYVVVFAVALEFLQLFVHSRVTDVTDVLSAIAGGGIGVRMGVALIRRFPEIGMQWHHRYRRAWVLMGLVAFAVWYVVIVWYYWFPFNFNFSAAYLSQRVSHVPTLPFWSHFPSNEFNVLADILRILLFFWPLGSILGFIAACLDKKRYRRHAVEAATVILLISAAFVEFGQFFLPGRYPDLTDVVFSLGAALMGYWLGYRLQLRYQARLKRHSDRAVA